MIHPSTWWFRFHVWLLDKGILKRKVLRTIFVDAANGMEVCTDAHLYSGSFRQGQDMIHDSKTWIVVGELRSRDDLAIVTVRRAQ